MGSILIKNGTIVRSGGEERADVLIEDGIIRSITPSELKTKNQELKTNYTIVDATGLLLFPGLIDCHVHFREPGLEHKETIATGMGAAFAGGVTTVCEMPNTIPPTVTVDALADKIRRWDRSVIPSSSRGQRERIEGRFFFGVTEKEHLAELRRLFTDPSLTDLRSRCCGVKLYLDHSTGNQKVAGAIVEDIFKTCAELGLTLVAHCEDSDMNAQSAAKNTRSDIAAHSEVRPAESEAKSIEFAIGLAKKFGTKFHVAHLSTKQGIDLVRAAKKSGITVTCEVAPHHLFLTTDDYASLGTLAKMNPPLRTREHQEALWKGVADGTVDCVSTDHAPHTLEEKKSGQPLSAPSGVPGVETMVPLLLSVAAGKNPKSQLQNPKLTHQDIVRLCFASPNRIFGLGKQGIKEGAPADIAIVDPKAEWTIHGKKLHSKCGWTPFEGWAVTGAVTKVV